MANGPLRCTGGENAHRQQLWRYLRERGFGYLQNSVWISPDPLKEEHQIIAGGKINVESLILLEARPCAGESDEQIVAGAWDFQRINRGYSQHLKVLAQRPTGGLRSETAAKTLRRWAVAEREAWLNAITKDPLLPQRILPPSYLGKRAWQRRKEILQEAGKALQTFKPRVASG